MSPSLSLLGAFVRRDLTTALSYRVPFLFEIAGALFGLALYFYLGRLIDESTGSLHDSLGGRYFPFVVVGVALQEIGHTGLTSFGNRVRQEQTTGTLEALLSTPASSSLVIVGSAAYDMLRATVLAVAVVLLGIGLFGLELHSGAAASIVVVVAVLACTMLFAALGVAVAAFTIVFKQTTALVSFVLPGVALLSGVYFPIALLPGPLHALASGSPFTWALMVLRSALLRDEVDARHLALLTVFAVVALPLALVLFRIAVRRARREGTLAQY